MSTPNDKNRPVYGSSFVFSSNSSKTVDATDNGIDFDGTNFNFKILGSTVAQVNAGGIAAIEELPDGSVSAPALTFASETGLGLYRVSSHKIAFASNTVAPLSITDTLVDSTVALRAISLDARTATTFAFGGTNATTISIGRSGQTVDFPGSVTAVAVDMSGALKSTSLDAHSSGPFTFGGTNATTITIGRAGQTVAIANTASVASTLTASSGFTVTTGAISMTGNAAASLTTSSGALTLTGAAASTWSTTGKLTVQANVDHSAGSAIVLNNPAAALTGADTLVELQNAGATVALIRADGAWQAPNDTYIPKLVGSDAAFNLNVNTSGIRLAAATAGKSIRACSGANSGGMQFFEEEDNQGALGNPSFKWGEFYGRSFTMDEASKISFFGVSTVARQTSGANLTNSVTSGGTDDTISNITAADVDTTAAKLTETRNALYQLARKLKQVNDALRLYGLLT